jgi:hypothetical protein
MAGHALLVMEFIVKTENPFETNGKLAFYDGKCNYLNLVNVNFDLTCLHSKTCQVNVNVL